MKVREIIRRVTAAGWVYKNTEGDHRHFVHPRRPGKVTIPGGRNDDVSPKMARSILRQAGLLDADGDD